MTPKNTAKISKNSSKIFCAHKWTGFFLCDGFSLKKCVRCDLIRTENKLKTMKEYSDTTIEEAVKQYWLRGDEYIKFASIFVDKLPSKKGTVLDIGCGLGWVVHEVNKRGYRGKGIDPNKGMTSYGKEKLNVDLKCVEFDKYHTFEKFDYITLSHVIEHIPDLHRLLIKIKSHLKQNGRVLIATPNIDSLMFKIFKCRWYPMSPHEHIWQFTPKTLSKILRYEGYEIEKVTITNMSYNPKNKIKKLIFDIANLFANVTGQGDQIILLARKHG